MTTFLYNRVFAYGSSQFCGHIEEYLAARSAELLIFIVEPRVGKHTNTVRRYSGGALVETRTVRSSQNLFLYYALWLANHVRFLLRFCPRSETTLIFGSHPIVYFGMGLFRRLRPLRYSYWVGDYFPSPKLTVRLFERLKKIYHDRVDYAFYLTDSINRVMNGGEVSCSPARRTVMWGLKPFPAAAVPPATPFSVLFVGLIRPGQGLEALFDYLAAHRTCRLSVIGVCQPDYFVRLQALLDRLDLRSQVFFPNRFYSEVELLEVARTCHVGVALYDTSSGNFTHYADPGKVKAYAEMRLPVLMTRISDIVPYVERFRSGEVIDRVEDIGAALERIQGDYAAYQAGIERFIAHFNFEAYYREGFRALEAEREEIERPVPVSVIVSMRNSASTIVACLKGLVSQDYPIAEVIVIDNVSSDESVALVEAFLPSSPVPIRLVRQSFDGGLAMSYNAGAELAKSPLLVFVHSDSMLPTSCELGRLVAPLLKDAKTVAAYSILLMPREVWARFPYWQKYLFGRMAMREAPCMCGKFDCVRKETFWSVGGHNVRRFTATCGYGGEDSDLNRRLRQAGPVAGSSARVIHLHDLSNRYGLRALFKTRKMLARTYGKIIVFQGVWPVAGKLAFFGKPALTLLPFVPHLFWPGLGVLLAFSLIYNRRMYLSRETLLNARILLVPWVDIALLYYEAFWFVEGLLTQPADAAGKAARDRA